MEKKNKDEKVSRESIAPYEDWYAIVLRINPEIILAVDRCLSRGLRLVRLAHPDIGPEDLAFRVLPEKEFNIIADSVEPPEEPPQSRISRDGGKRGRRKSN